MDAVYSAAVVLIDIEFKIPNKNLYSYSFSAADGGQPTVM